MRRSSGGSEYRRRDDTGLYRAWRGSEPAGERCEALARNPHAVYDRAQWAGSLHRLARARFAIALHNRDGSLAERHRGAGGVSGRAAQARRRERWGETAPVCPFRRKFRRACENASPAKPLSTRAMCRTNIPCPALSWPIFGCHDSAGPEGPGNTIGRIMYFEQGRAEDGYVPVRAGRFLPEWTASGTGSRFEGWFRTVCPEPRRCAWRLAIAPARRSEIVDVNRGKASCVSRERSSGKMQWGKRSATYP